MSIRALSLLACGAESTRCGEFVTPPGASSPHAGVPSVAAGAIRGAGAPFGRHILERGGGVTPGIGAVSLLGESVTATVPTVDTTGNPALIRFSFTNTGPHGRHGGYRHLSGPAKLRFSQLVPGGLPEGRWRQRGTVGPNHLLRPRTKRSRRPSRTSPVFRWMRS